MDEKEKLHIVIKMLNHRKNLDEFRYGVMRLFGCQETGSYFEQIERMFEEYMTNTAKILNCERETLAWFISNGNETMTIEYFVRAKCK